MADIDKTDTNPEDEFIKEWIAAEVLATSTNGTVRGPRDQGCIEECRVSYCPSSSWKSKSATYTNRQLRFGQPPEDQSKSSRAVLLTRLTGSLAWPVFCRPHTAAVPFTAYYPINSE